MVAAFLQRTTVKKIVREREKDKKRESEREPEREKEKEGEKWRGKGTDRQTNRREYNFLYVLTNERSGMVQTKDNRKKSKTDRQIEK